MALIKCPKCGTLVSDKADSCPVCGKPVSSILAEANGEVPAAPVVEQQPPVMPASPAEPIPPSAPYAPAEAKNRSSRKMLVTLLITVSYLLLAMIGIGVAFILKSKHKDVPVAVGSATTPSPATSPVPSSLQPDTPSQSTGTSSAAASRPAPRQSSSSSGVPGVYPEGSTRYLSDYELIDKSLWELMIMRNEIYARHHYVFKRSELIEYFGRQSWYVGYEPDAKAVYRTFSDIEKSNVSLIKSYEKLLK